MDSSGTSDANRSELPASLNHSSHSTSSPIHVGILGWNALPLFVPGANPASGFGGMETSIAALARSLALRDDLDVTLLVRADHAKPVRESEGTRVWPTHVDELKLDVHVDRFRVMRNRVSDCIDIRDRKWRRWDWNLAWQIPVLVLTRPFRSRDPSPESMDRRMGHHDVDVWVCFGDGLESYRAIRTARQLKTPVVLWLQSNAGLTETTLRTPHHVNQVGESAWHQHQCMHLADAVVCQTQWQRDRVVQNFDRPAHLIANGIDLADWQLGRKKSDSAEVLWIGRADDFHKRPLRMLEVVRRCPELSFRMILNPFDDAIEANVRSQCPPNVRLLDRVAFDEMPEQFSNACVFASTGNPDSEGFPNVLLQAAATHTPIVSLVDFDGFLSRSGAGVGCQESVEMMASQIQSHATAPKVNWSDVDAYMQQHHAPEVLLERFVELLSRLAQSKLVR